MNTYFSIMIMLMESFVALVLQNQILINIVSVFTQFPDAFEN